MGSLLRPSQTTYGAKRPWARAALIGSAIGKVAPPARGARVVLRTII
jgi:hypothetical protein